MQNKQIIEISNLALGMFVETVGEGTFKSPTISVNTLLRTQEQLDSLLASGAKSAIVNLEKARDLTKANVPHVSDLLNFAADVHEIGSRMKQAVAYSRSMLEDVRLGKSVNSTEASDVVRTMLNNIFKNQSAALFLTKLGNYDDYTYMHCVNVSVLASIFGRHLGLGNDELFALGLSGLLHDLGKALIPDSILNKPGKLSDDEFAVMRSHPKLGYDLVKNVSGLSKEAVLGALEHHEKWAGGGYPDGKRGEQISRFARILAVVDVYDAMTSNRVYHKGRPETDVLAYLFKNKSSFATGYVELFVKTVGIYPPGTLIRLSNGLLALVCANSANSLRPAVTLVCEETGALDQGCLTFDDLEEQHGPLKIVEVVDKQGFQVDISSLGS